MKMFAFPLIMFMVLFQSLFLTETAQAADDKEYKVAWSHYVGWVLWQWIEDQGILAKNCQKYGVKVKVELVNDYVESINLYTTGEYIACTMTNMDALTIPAVGGIDSTALIVGDFSNGNDGICMVGGNSVKDLRGREILLVELTVSHYLLAQALDKNGMSERDVTVINCSDADIVSMYAASASNSNAVVTWNPLLMQVRNLPNVNTVFDSSEIPGDIMDLLVIKTDAPEGVKRALVDSWYEAMAVLKAGGQRAEEAIAYMAELEGCTPAEFKAQLKTTQMFFDPAEAAKFASGDGVIMTMDRVRTFSFDHGLYGAGAPSKEVVGIQFPNGTILGDPQNIKLRFDDNYMQKVASRE